MNNPLKITLATFIILIIVFSLAYLVILSPIDRQIKQTHLQYDQAETSLKDLETKLQSLKQKYPNGIKPDKKKSKLLIPGQEASLLRKISACAEKRMKISSFDLLKSFRVKGKDTEEIAASAAPAFQPGAELPKLDENGMPIGIATDDDTEWEGVEVIPVKIKFSSTYRGLGKFLSNVRKALPLHSIRNMDFLSQTSGIYRGTILLTFPVAGS